jgi:hypothetical protein
MIPKLKCAIVVEIITISYKPIYEIKIKKQPDLRWTLLFNKSTICPTIDAVLYNSYDLVHSSQY